MASATSSLSALRPPPWPSQGTSARVAVESTFAREIDRLLRALGLSNIRLTLLAIAAREPSRDFLEDAACLALGSSALVGILPEGSVGVLYVGPRRDGEGADRDVVNDIARQIRTALSTQFPAGGEPPLYLRAVHRWTDEVESAHDLIRMLPQIPARRTSAREPPSEPHPTSPAAAPGLDRPGTLARRWSGRRLFCLATGLVASWVAPWATIWLVAGPAAVRAAEAPATVGAAAAATAISIAPRTGADSGAAVATDVMRGMDASDKARIADALIRVSDGTDVEWINTSSGIRYTVFLVKTELLADGSVCRSFTVTAIVGETVQQVYRMNCRRPEAKGAVSRVLDRSSPATAEKGISS